MRNHRVHVTIVIPVWDAYVERYLDETLESVRAQDVPARVVVIDNASEVPVVVPEEVAVLRTPTRLTLGGIRNFGLAHVETPFVIFWDADDVMLPGALGALIDGAAESEDAVVVSGRIHEADPRVEHHWPRRWTPRLACAPSLFALVHCVYSLFPTIGVLIRTNAAVGAGGFPDTAAGDDWILGVSLGFRGRIAFIPHGTRLYRAHGESVSSRWRTWPHVLENARGVRERMRSDPAVPSWGRALVPLIAVLQHAVIFGVRPAARFARRLRRRAHG